MSTIRAIVALLMWGLVIAVAGSGTPRPAS